VNGLDIDVAAVLDRSFSGDCGVPGSAELLRFADAVLGGGDIAAARAAVATALGDDAVWEAAATVAAFCGLVRVADGTGIPVDDGMLAASADLRAAHGIDGFAGATNSGPVVVTDVDHTDVEALFR